MRLDKFLCDLNIATRKDAKKLIKQKAIKVNNIIATDPAQKINEYTDIVEFNHQILHYQQYVYYMLNKPADVVSATEDNLSETVINLLKAEPFKDLFPVGRLDKDTTGLLIITNDGQFSHNLTSPSHHVDKTYEVTIEKSLSPKDIEKLENGVELINDGITKPAKVNVINDNLIHLTISEGKYHQVKRMLAAVSNKVIKLKRISIGNLKLDETLAEGEYRLLTDSEIEALK